MISYPESLQKAFDEKTTFSLDWFGAILEWRIFGLDAHYGIAELECVQGDYEGADMKGTRQSIALDKLDAILSLSEV